MFSLVNTDAGVMYSTPFHSDITHVSPHSTTSIRNVQYHSTLHHTTPLHYTHTTPGANHSTTPLVTPAWSAVTREDEGRIRRVEEEIPRQRSRTKGQRQPGRLAAYPGDLDQSTPDLVPIQKTLGPSGPAG